MKDAAEFIWKKPARPRPVILYGGPNGEKQ